MTDIILDFNNFLALQSLILAGSHHVTFFRRQCSTTTSYTLRNQ
jgi:hypothetical protein